MPCKEPDRPAGAPGPASRLKGQQKIFLESQVAQNYGHSAPKQSSLRVAQTTGRWFSRSFSCKFDTPAVLQAFAAAAAGDSRKREDAKQWRGAGPGKITEQHGYCSEHMFASLCVQ